MKKILVIIVVFLIILSTSVTAFAADWSFIDGRKGTGNWSNGLFVTSDNHYICGPNSQVLIDGKYYRFNDDGSVITGWYYANKAWYYYQNDTEPIGQAVTGWKQIDQTWYYFDSSGELSNTYTYTYEYNTDWYNGWYQSGGEWYYLKNGYVTTGWKQIDGYWYYFKSDGKMATEWCYVVGGYDSHTSGNHTYFFNDGSYPYSPKGAMLKSCVVNGIHVNRYGFADES